MKKVFILAAACCFAVVAALFTSCNADQKSSYQYIVGLDDSIEQKLRYLQGHQSQCRQAC